MLHIIPVIDLLNGTVVHAKKGERERYQPIESALTASSKPLDIVKAFLDIYPFKTLYIADLDAIQKRGENKASNLNAIEEISNAFPNLKLWIDAGINKPKALQAWEKLEAQLVLGSESFTKIENYSMLASQAKAPHTLSLDFMSDGYKGPKELLNNDKYWPKDIIVITLKQVGANTGVDTKTLQSIINKANVNKTSHHNIYAAGGVRNLNDLLLLEQIGAKGTLLASALHNKQIPTQDLQSISAE